MRGQLTTPLVLVVTLLALGGCSSLESLSFDGFGAAREGGERAAEEHRKAYQETRASADIQWLLANRVDAGMDLADVNRIIGNAGERVYDDRQFVTSSVGYRSGDTFYKWGPDNSGKSYFLGFRDRKLVNFDPRSIEVEGQFGE